MNAIKYLILLFILATHFVSHSQSIGIGTNLPEVSALLELKSSSKGMLLPRLTRSQIKSILLPTAGLVLYNSTENKPVYYDGNFWRFYNDSIMPIQLGDNIGGGTVFYLDSTGKHGLIAAPTDQSSGMKWGCYNYVTAANATAIGTGQNNTTMIVSTVCGAANTPAAICDSLILNGFSDWFLPSKDELRTWMFYSDSHGGFPYVSPGNNFFYWSSSEFDSISTWNYIISTAWDGSYIRAEHYAKDQLFRVRAIRKF